MQHLIYSAHKYHYAFTFLRDISQKCDMRFALSAPDELMNKVKHRTVFSKEVQVQSDHNTSFLCFKMMQNTDTDMSDRNESGERCAANETIATHWK